MTATAPAHFFGLEPLDLLARSDRGMGIRIGRQRITLDQRMRHQWCSPRARGERHATCRKSKGEFQKVPAFHHVSSFVLRSHVGGVSARRYEYSLNCAFRFVVSANAKTDTPRRS
jgi:hypothetical protein